MPIIEGFTEATSRRSAAPVEGFTPTFISPLPAKDPERTFLGTLGDVGVMALKGAVGLPQAFAGLADIPTGGRAGKALEELGYRPEETQKLLDTWYSDAQQAANRKVQEADGFLGTVGTALQNPSTILTAAGESLPQMLGGAGIARGLLKVAPKVAPVVAGAVGEGILGAGSAASQIRSQTEDGLLTPGQSAAAAASGFGTGVLSLAGGRLAARMGLGDVDTALAQGAMGAGNRGLMRNVAGSAFSEGVLEELPQSMQEQVWQNIALDRPWDEGVGKAGAMGMLAGGLTGGGFGALNNRAVESDLLRRDRAVADAERARQEQLAPILGLIRDDPGVPLQNWVEQQVGVGAPLDDKARKAREADITAAFDAPSGVRVAGEDGTERELSAIEASLLSQGLPTGPTAAPAPPPAPSKVYTPEEQELIDMGVVPNGKALELLSEIKASGLPLESLTPVVTAMSERKNGRAKTLLAQAIIESKKAPAAAPAAPAPSLVPPNLRLPTAEQIAADQQANPQDWGPSLNVQAPAPTAAVPGDTSLPVTEAPAQGTAPAVESVTNAPASEAQPTVDAEIAAQPQAGAPTEPVVQRKRRVVNPAALAQSQAFVAPEPTVEEEATAEATDETDWEDSKPDGAPTLAALTPSLRQVWSEARAAKAQGRRVNLFKVAEDLVAEQGDGVAEDDTLTTLNQIFGERDAAMLYDRYVDNMTEEAIANKYGLSRQTVQKVTGEGELGAKTRATRIKNAQKKFGWTDDYVTQLAARLTPAQAQAQDDAVVPQSGRAAASLEATETAFGADTAPETGGRDPSLREAGFSTSASLGGSVSNWRDTGELAGREDVTQADQKKLDELYAKRAAAEQAGQDDKVEEADAAISQVETKYLTPGEVAAKITQKSMDLRDKAAKRAEQIAQARAAGKTEVSVNNKMVPVAQLEQEVADLQAKAEAEIERAEGVLQRGAVRKAKGAEPPKAPKVRRVKKAEAAAPAPAAPVDKILTPTEQAGQSWDQAANTIPGAPKWAELPELTRREFVAFGENNWTRQDVVALMQRSAPQAAREDAQEQGAKPDRVEGPSGYSFPSEQAVYEIRQAFAPMEVSASAIGSTEDGYVNFGRNYPDGRFYVESLGRSVVFGNGKWGTPTPDGIKEEGTYDPARFKEEVVRVLTALGAKPRPGSGAKFGKAKGAGAVKNGYTAAELIEDIKAFIRADVLGRKLVVVDTVDDLLKSPLKSRRAVGAEIVAQSLKGNIAYGVATDGTAYLVANRIAKGEGRAKFMHEVGGHLGLENLLPKAVYDKLVNQIIAWAKQDNGSTESEVALAAVKRTMDANTPAADQRSEILAYFLEEAVQRGIDPTTNTMRGSSALREWFRTLWAAFKTAVRRLGFKPESMTAQDIVNMAFGAARLEIAGTWHGTAAEVETLRGEKIPFRRFDHSKMGSGEGAQAYGAGTYIAQSMGLGRRYWEADVDRKTQREKTTFRYDGVDAGFHGDAVLNTAINLVYGEMVPPRGVGWQNFKVGLEEAIRLAVANVEREIARGERLVFSAEKNNSPGLDDLRESLAFERDVLNELNSLDPAKFEVDFQAASSPEGSLMRVDTAVTQDELLDWDAPMDEQPKVVRDAFARLGMYTPGKIAESGGEAYARLVRQAGLAKFATLGRSSRWILKKPTLNYVDLMVNGRRVVVEGDNKAAADLLDSLGVKGVRHIDGPSRKKAFQGYKDQASIKAAFNAIDPAVRKSMMLRNALDLAQDIEDINPLDRVLRGLKLDPTSDAADAIARYKEWLDTKTRNLVIFNDKNIFRVGAQVGADRQRMRFGVNATQRLPAELEKPVGVVTNTLRDVGNTALNLMTFTEDVINRAIELGVKSAGKLRTVYQERAALTGKLEREVERVADLYNKVPEAERGTGPKSVNQFLYDATREGKWGFKPDWRKGTSANVAIDADMKQRFDALSKESKALVRAVFTHGDEVLSLKKQTVIDATNSEYDALIAAAQKQGDSKKAARLTADKADQLKRFTSLFALQEFRPYAPLKRFGDYVVIARSQKYLDADEKTRAKLENSGDDYHVSFAESAAAAREMVEQLQKQGAFADVVFRQKEAVQQTMFGGMLSAFNKLRSELDSELADAAPGEKNALRAARKVVGELYLSSLAESSARKSEMRRRGVAGEIDMLRSFTSQGRADAQFIAGAKFNNQTLDVFNAMRKEVKSGDAETQNTKSGVFNELMKRHTQSMDYDPTPIASKLARLTSIWFLATSPAYYLQNLTQPFMMSMPVMAAKHNYLKVGNALMRAYTDLAPMFRTAKLGEQFNYAAAPQDVRAAISTLVDRGRIDIGLDTDLGEFRLEGEGPVKDRWNKVDRGIRNVAQKLEAVNRLSTAIAAYRLELARTGKPEDALQYADDIITQTHGDYTSGNAPRAFNTATGKVALQFRKFQLIQLTLLAKLLKNSFSGKEQAAARTALGFLLGHTAVMAGAIGLPGFAAISWALGALMGGGDDEPFNLESELREWVGNEQVATLITRGAPAALGVDLSNKLGMGNVLSLLPFNEMDLSSRSGVESAGFAIFGGPAGGLTLRAIDGLNLMRDGQYYRGLEQLMPTGVTNAMKSYRQATEGVTRRNGDELISPEEISGMDTFWQAIGFQPTDLAVRQFRDRVKREADDKFQSRAEKIRNAYLRAKDDPDARAEARERWMTLQDAREEAGYRRQPLSSLMRAEQNQRQRERNTLGGIQFNRDTRRFVEELTEE